jgi:hypothetical protein
MNKKFMKAHSSFSFCFEKTDAEKKSLVWNLFKRYPDYNEDIKESCLISTIVLAIRSRYGAHRKSYLRFCTSLTSSLHRINYLERWFSQGVDTLHFLVSLPTFAKFPRKEKSSIQRFVEKFETTALEVWFLSVQLKDQISSTRDFSRAGEDAFQCNDDSIDDDELEDAF